MKEYLGANVVDRAPDRACEGVAAQPQLALILSRVHDGIARLQRCTERVTTTADRVFGIAPKEATRGDAGGPMTDGTIPALYAALDFLHSEITRMEYATDRFDEL